MLSRRDFLKFCGLALGGLGLDWLGPRRVPLIPPDSRTPKMKGRVTTSLINIYAEPNFKSKRLGRIKRDTIVPLLEEIDSTYGPKYNPRWYHMREGCVHSGYLQRVEGAYLNEPIEAIPEGGQLGEITVPISQSWRNIPVLGWRPLYRLYYQSVYWVTSIGEGPDGEAWYELTDDLLRVKYHVPAAHVRLIQAEELAPISPGVSDEEKRILVSLVDQTLTAYEGEKVVLKTTVSTGVPSHLVKSEGGNEGKDEIDTETPEGFFRVQVKTPTRHMGDGSLTSNPAAYELPGVPWVSFFYKTGVAFHGTYWHDNFSHKMSHGCVNMRTQDAQWLYRWTTPTAAYNEWRCLGNGTRVEVT